MPSDTLMPAAYYQYRADITGLDAGVTYPYQVLMNGQVLATGPSEYSFRTPAPGNFSFLVFGDSGSGSPQELALVQQMAAEPNIAKVVHVGDLAYMSGTFAEFQSNYYAPNAPLMSRLPFFATPGNHDYETDSAAPYLSGQATPASNVPAADMGRYYSFDWGDAHFTAVDSNLLTAADAAARMLAWLDADLAASPKYWKIVFLHHCPYPTGYHVGDPICALVQQNVNPIVEKHGVQLMLTGHEHGYERSWPLVANQTVPSTTPSTTYVITGGGGGALENVGSLPQCALSIQAFNYLRVDVAGTGLTFTAKGLNGNALDSVTLNPPPLVAPNGVLNAGDYSTGIAPGSLVSLFGQNFALRPASAATFPLPESLGGITASANGIAVPLLYVSPGQINFQMPFNVSGQVNLQIRTANGVASASVNVVPTAPSLLAMATQNGLISSTSPVQPGSYVTLYVTGLGTPTSPVATGQAAPGKAVPVAANVLVLLGDTIIVPSYAGMAPGFAGVNQINFQVPAGLSPGVYALSVVASLVSSAHTSFTVGAPAAGSGANARRAGAVHSIAGLPAFTESRPSANF
jgi:acid phosphatase type 7